MAFQLSTEARNATLAAIETEIGVNPVLTISTGSVPANAGTANTGVVVATMVLPSDWLANPEVDPLHFRVHGKIYLQMLQEPLVTSDYIMVLAQYVICKAQFQQLELEATCS